MTAINLKERKRLERKLNLFLTLYETATKGEKEALLRDIITIEQKLGIQTKREVKKVKKKHLPFTTEQILADLNEGLTQAEVAEKYKLSEGYVSKIKQKHIGVRYEVTGKYEKLTPIDLARLLNEGHSVSDIATMYKMTTRGVVLVKSKYLKKQFYMKEG